MSSLWLCVEIQAGMKFRQESRMDWPHFALLRPDAAVKLPPHFAWTIEIDVTSSLETEFGAFRMAIAAAPYSASAWQSGG
jgi:hypothetical protein